MGESKKEKSFEEKQMPVSTVEEFVDWMIQYHKLDGTDDQRDNLIYNLKTQIERYILHDRLVRPTVIVNNYFSIFGKKNASNITTL